MTNFNISDVYQWCMEVTDGDAEYCADVKAVAAQVAATRVFSYIRNNIKFLLVLPGIIYISKLIDEGDTTVLFAVKATYAAKILLDEQKKVIAVLLEAPNHIVTLVYERFSYEKGKTVLKKAIVTNRELSALINGPLKLPE